MAEDFRRVARRKALKYGLDPDIFVRQIGAESNFDPDVIYGRRVSSAGAQGIAQIMPATARGWGVNPLKPRQALDAAAKNMAQYVKQYGSYENALRAYNAGPGAIQASKGYAETNAYVQKILGGRDPGRLGQPRSPRPGGGGGGGGGGTFDRVRLGQKTTFDEAGYEQAKRTALVGSLIAKRRGTDNILFRSGLLSTTPPSPGDFTQTGLTSQLVKGTRGRGGTGVKGPTLVIGDSLGVGTLPYLERMLGGKVVADVVGGRSSANGIKAMRKRLAGRDFSNIVLDLGTNDLTARQLAQSVRQARRLAPNAQIYLPTLNGPYATQRKNQILQRIAANDPNVHLVPWRSNSRGQLVDGIHASAQGYQARARLIAETMGARAPERTQRPADRRSLGGSIRPRGPLLEMFYNGPGGINVDENRRVGRGYVAGHESHVHYGADPKTVVEIGRMAQRMGLNVGEHPKFGTVTQGAHVTNSLHYSGRAIDVTGDQRKLLEFNRKVARIYGL